MRSPGRPRFRFIAGRGRDKPLSGRCTTTFVSFGVGGEDLRQSPASRWGTCSAHQPCDCDRNGTVNVDDINVIAHSLNTFTVAGDPRDPNGDLTIDAQDVRWCTQQCAGPGCGR